MSNSLWPHGLQDARLPCPSLSPGVFSDSCPLSQWYDSTISSSVSPFSFCLQSFPASRSFPVSWLFTLGCQSIEASASASVLSLNIQGWFLMNWFDPLAVQGTVKTLRQHCSSKALILQCLAFFMVQFCHPYMKKP